MTELAGGSSRQSSPLPLESPSDGSFTSLLNRRGELPRWDTGGEGAEIEVPEATTILALRYRDGVVMAGDRRATAGNVIAHRRMRKVFAADSHSAVAISGTAGMAVELIKLFQTELEHYEKIEGVRLSLEGKANYLARMVRGNLAMAFQGLVVVPLLAGHDELDNTGKLYTFDVVGGRYEEQDYAATGSGGMEARAFLKGVFRDDLERADALSIAVEALVAASEEDAATGGPDLRRGIFPNVITVTEDGFVEASDDEIFSVATTVMAARP